MYKVEEMNLTIGKLLGRVVTIRFRGHIKLYQIVYAECLATDLALYHGEYNKKRHDYEINKIAIL